jgi:hypothetical protein
MNLQIGFYFISSFEIVFSYLTLVYNKKSIVGKHKSLALQIWQTLKVSNGRKISFLFNRLNEIT